MERMTDIWTGLVLVSAAATTAAWLVLAANVRFPALRARLSCVRRSGFSVFLLFSLAATLCAQKTNSPPLRVMGPPLAMQQLSTVSPADVARGYRLDYEFTNGAYSYSMPMNASRHEKWWRRGAYEDVFRLDLGGMAFPLGDELLSSVWVYSWGMAGAHLGNASNRLVATGTPMSAVPSLSQFWSAALPDGARRLTWQDFALNRDTNNLVSAQLELFPNGDFIARSNEVMRVYCRVNPDDWDDDGDPNDEDPEPMIAGEPTFGPQQQLPEGANSNAYCWVDLVVSGAASLVAFSGNGASNLSDPSFIALPGETNRVKLLIGKEYHVSSRMPICCVGRSDYAIEVSQESPTSLSIIWPVTIEPVAVRSGASFSMSVVPDFLGGGFTWTNCCCSISSSGNSFTYSCDENCHCTGCAAFGYYAYEGFTLSARGGSCGCGETSGPGEDEIEEEDDPAPHAAAASASFSKGAVIFEDGYWNTPTNWVGRRSTTTELHCVAYGGPNGGHVRFEIAGENKLERVSGPALPVEQDVGSGKMIDFTVRYTGQLPSSAAEDIVVTTTFTENAEGATPSSSQSKLTSVKVELSSLSVSLDDYPKRHIRGIGEAVCCEWTPFVSGLSFQTQNGAVCFKSYSNRRDVTCPFQSASGICEISVCGATYTPMVQVLEPTDIEARNPHRLSFAVPVNSPGGAGFEMDLHIMPDTVSFQALEFWERPNLASTIVDYFTNTAFQAVWYHDTSMGAGVWRRISGSNFWFKDAAQMGDELITPVYEGRLVWHIPVDWRKADDPTLIHQNFKPVDQTFEMSGTGRLTVRKYQHWAAREMSGATLKSEGMTE